MIELVEAKNPYKPDNGDLVCDMFNKTASKFLVNEEGIRSLKVIPLAIVHCNPWTAAKAFDIDTTPIQVKYECPYTGYKHFAIVPSALIINGNVDVYKKVKHFDSDYVLDWAWHKHMFKDKVYQISEIQSLLLGSGYTSGTLATDGSRGIEKRRVMLDNGDALWVFFYEWYNK